MESKIQMMWKVSKEQQEEFIKRLPNEFSEIETSELFKLIRGAEYRRGKEDAERSLSTKISKEKG